MSIPHLDLHPSYILHIKKRANAGLQLRRAISIQAEGKRLLEKHAIAPSAPRLCSTARSISKMAEIPIAGQMFGGSKIAANPKPFIYSLRFHYAAAGIVDDIVPVQESIDVMKRYS